MTKITIEVDASGAVQTQAPGMASGTSEAQNTGSSSGSTSSSGANDGTSAGAAPYADASHVGPFPFSQASSSDSAPDPAFDPAGAISAGPAPESLMMMATGGVQ